MIRNRHNYFALGAFMLATAVVLGAFGAHGLENKISLHYLGTWKTASEYLVYNALGLMAFAAFNDGDVDYTDNKHFRISIFSIILGVFIFSVSLYLVALNQLIGESFKKMGMIAPIGGVLMAFGWVGLGYHFVMHKKQKS